MRITESMLRRIIREEARRVLREDDQQAESSGDLKVSKASWYNEHGPDGGSVTISFEWESSDGSEQVTSPELEIYFDSSPNTEDGLIKRITSEINSEIADKLRKDDYEAQRVNEDQVGAAINAAPEQNSESENIESMFSQMEANFSSDNSGDW